MSMDAPVHPAEGNGCYICQPENPNADPEGCAACEREWWAWYFARVTSPTERLPAVRGRGRGMSRRRITDWPLRWPLNLFCSHPSTSGIAVRQEDGSYRELDVECLRCGRHVRPVDPRLWTWFL